jgi:5-methylcytosine-specific restriction endonuclease McrA
MSIIKKIKDTIQGIPGKRSSKWQTVRKHYIEKNNVCAICGSTEVLEVHHKKPFHLDPTLELDPNNLITLCESKKNGVTCHLWFGHLGDYHSFNENIEEDAKLWKEKLENRPKN